MEKKCENCVFRTPKPENMSFLPNDFICGSHLSKWHGYWPVNGCCERFAEPTGKTVEDALEENGRAKPMLEGMSAMLSGMWEKETKEWLDGFMKQDSAVLNEYGWTNQEGFESFISNMGDNQ